MANLHHLRVSCTFLYDPFGMITVGRSWEIGIEYRYGFNGKEQDDDVAGNGNIYDYGFRIYNPRIGKFLSVDPLTKSFPWLSPYQFAENNPTWRIDIDGLEAGPSDANSESGSDPNVIYFHELEPFIVFANDYPDYEEFGLIDPIQYTECQLGGNVNIKIPTYETYNFSHSQNSGETDEDKTIETPTWLYISSFSISATDDVILPAYKSDIVKGINQNYLVTTLNKNTQLEGYNGIKWISNDPGKLAKVSTPGWMFKTAPVLKYAGYVGDGLDIGISFYNAAVSEDPNDIIYYSVEGFLKTPQCLPGIFGFAYGASFDVVVRPIWEQGAKTYSYATERGADPSINFIMGGLGYAPQIKY